MNSISVISICVVIFISTVSGSAYSYVKRTDGSSYSYEVGGHSHSSPTFQQSHHHQQQTHHQPSQIQQRPQQNFQPQFGQKTSAIQSNHQQSNVRSGYENQQQRNFQQTHQNQESLPNSQSTQQIQTQSPQQQSNVQSGYESQFTAETQNRGNIQGTNNYGQQGQIQPPTHSSLQPPQSYSQPQSSTQNFGHGFSGGDQKGFAYPKYKFEYGVKDPRTGDHKSQWEIRDGDVVKGEYTLDEADGTKRIVEYKADGKSGFSAIVKKIGHAHHPEIQVFGTPF